jgi:hypothetical protein
MKRLFGIDVWTRLGVRWAGNNGYDRNVEEIIPALNVILLTQSLSTRIQTDQPSMPRRKRRKMKNAFTV